MTQPARTVIPHVDDLGASHGANAAFLHLARRGLVTCGSVMVPGPWFREVAEAAAADPSLDIGIHLTLTSEWDTCRWAPISTVNRASGLIDGDGYFWRDVASLHRHLVPEAAETELRAQIDRALAAGISPTHIDAHMAAAMLPELLPVHVALAQEYGLFPVLPRTITWPPNLAAYQATIASLDAAGLPVLDHCRGTLAVEADALDAGWAALVNGLQPGTTHLALHCTVSGEFSAMAPAHAGWRHREFDLLASGRLDELLAHAGIAAAGLRPWQTRWQNDP